MGENIDKVVQELQSTLKERGDKYKNTLPLATQVMSLLKENLPEGDIDETQLFILHLMVLKLCRFVCSGLTHKDSLVDKAGYAMLAKAHLDACKSPLKCEGK